jgi:hypothetical protein
MGVFRRGGGRLRGDITKYILVKAGEELGVVGAFLAAGRWGAAAVPRQAGDHKGQSISKKRPSRFVIPSLRSRASSERSEGSLAGQRSFAALRMTKRDGLFFEMYWVLCMTLRHTLYWFMLMDERKRIDRMRSTYVYRKKGFHL